MGEHVAGVGKGLTQAVDRYNSFVGSLESQVLTQAKRFEDLAANHEGKTIPVLQPVETGIRPLAKLSAAPAPALTPPDAHLT
jgi:DNA recombination protein RmuC